MHPKHCSDYPKSCKKRNRILHHISSFDRQAEKDCKLMHGIMVFHMQKLLFVCRGKIKIHHSKVQSCPV